MTSRPLTLSIALAALSLAASAQTGTPCTVGDLPQNLQNGLVFYTPYCGNANDIGTGSHTGSVNGATLSTDRFLNPDSAYTFNGTNNSINYGQVPDVLGNDSLTVCFWLKHPVHSNYQYDVVLSNVGVLGQGGGYQFYIHNASGKLRFEYRYSTTATTGYVSNWNTVVPTNTWTFYTATYRKAGALGVVYLYRNGVLDGSFSYANPMDFTVPGALRIGTNIDTTLQRYFSGQIDDIMVYDRVLTVPEIGQIYNGFIGPAGVAETDLASAITCFPNPVTDILTLDGPINAWPALITVCDAYGRVVLRAKPTASPFALDLNDLAPGVYTLTFNNGPGRRVIKQ